MDRMTPFQLILKVSLDKERPASSDFTRQKIKKSPLGRYSATGWVVD
jgi:hypothetical protein